MGNFKVTNWWSLNANTNIFHYDVSANIDETMVNNKKPFLVFSISKLY